MFASGSADDIKVTRVGLINQWSENSLALTLNSTHFLFLCISGESIVVVFVQVQFPSKDLRFIDLPNVDCSFITLLLCFGNMYFIHLIVLCYIH